MKTLLELYESSKAVSSEEVEARGFACAKIAGLALAMHEHFTCGVNECGMLEARSAMDVAMLAYDLGKKHSKDIEQIAKKDKA